MHKFSTDSESDKGGSGYQYSTDNEILVYSYPLAVLLKPTSHQQYFARDFLMKR